MAKTPTKRPAKKAVKKAAPKILGPRIVVPERRIVVPNMPDFSKPLDLSRVDWEDCIRARSSLMPVGLLDYLDQQRSDLAVQVFNKLHLPDVAEKLTFEEAAGEWFRDIVRAVFGSWNGIQRAINEFFIVVPKKNSKTTNSAGIMVTAMIRSERPRAEFLFVAPTQQVSSIAFNQALGMIESDPKLLEMCQVQDYIKKITFLPNKCTLRIKSFDPAILTGTKPAGVLLDELHVIAEHNSADRVIGQIRGGLISQPEGFMITITTQSERVPAGVFRAELLKARKVRDGLAKLKLLPIIYEFPDDLIHDKDDPTMPSEAWKDPKNWDMVTPNNGRSITVERLYEDYLNAVESGEEEVKRWASQHLNIEIGMALRSNHWTGAKFWPVTAEEVTLESLIARSEVITIGIDGGGLDDMLAITMCGRESAETKKWLTWSHAWVHKIAMERRKADIPVYKDFQRDGDLTIVEDLGEDVTELGEYVEQVFKSGKFNRVGVDPSAIGAILDELVSRGLDQEKHIVGISQGWRLTAAIKTTERKLASGEMSHAIQPLTRWCAENARVEPKGNAILITKQASGTAKIDPLMSLFNAVELMSQNPAAEPKYQMFFVGGNES